MKTLHNSTSSQAKDNVKDMITFGDSNTFKLICKASSEEEGWMKSTKAMEIVGVGCVIQVTTQQQQPHYEHYVETETCALAEALTFVPGVKIEEALDVAGKVYSRRIVAI